MTDDPKARLVDLLTRRFGATVDVPDGLEIPATWSDIAGRGSCRAFAPTPVPGALIETLAALALSAPSKSDLQQRDIVILDDRDVRGEIDRMLTEGPGAQAWVSGAPLMLLFLGNNRRQRQLHDWRGKPFANDHLDAFFNAAVDAGIALATFVVAAEAAGLGCTPISVIRNHAEAVSKLIGLPDHVFPVAGLAVGWPARTPPRISPRLPLSATVHRNRFDETGLREAVDAYDRRRHAVQPYTAQRGADRYPAVDLYGWSEDKVRQYAAPERADWGAFVRSKGFRLE